MESFNDGQLLRLFATERSERAFRELVGRHKDLVFSAARRKLGNDEAAADVAQNVFAVLARKAPWLSGRTSIGGWLYKSTLLEAARRQRDDLRRYNRERLYAEDMNIRGNSDEDTDAARAGALLPLLDDAMASLSPVDREAILLRFFQGRSLRETGQALGSTEEAARKRVTRALDRLSKMFQRRGVQVSASVLAAVVLPQAHATAPASVAAQAAAAGLSAPAHGWGAAFYLKMLGATKLQTAALCVGLAGVPIAWQAREIRQLKAEKAALASVSAVVPESVEAAPPLAAVNQTKPPSSAPAGNRLASSGGREGGGDAKGRRGGGPPWEKMRAAERTRLRQARLLAMQSQLGLTQEQSEAAARIAQEAEAAQDALMAESMRLRRPPEREKLVQISTQRDEELRAIFDGKQQAGYEDFLKAEARGRQEKFANRMLGDMQDIVYLTDEQKDRIFGIFAAQAAQKDWESPWGMGMESVGEEQTAQLQAILSEEQFKFWKQWVDFRGEFFRPRNEPPKGDSARPAEAPKVQ